MSFRFIIAGLICVAAAQGIGAQTGTVEESPLATTFILPLGARNVGMGMASVATATGSEAAWWNPALVARGQRETALHYLTQLVPGSSTDIAAAVVWPLPPVGAVAFSVRYLNAGTFPALNDQQQQTGSFVDNELAPAATFATTFSRFFAAGFTLKRLMLLLPCTGDCGPNLPPSAAVNALDAGAQLFVTRDSTISIAATVRSIGPHLQLKDKPQADPLPSRAAAGIAYMPKLPAEKQLTSVVTAEIVTRVGGSGSPGYRFGGELTYRGLYSARAGYMVYGPAELSTATYGVGIHSGKLQIDIAQLLSDLGGNGSRPTLFSLRYEF